MFNTKYPKEKSKLFKIEANLLCVLSYFIGLVGIVLVSYADFDLKYYYLLALVPIIALIFEKDSEFIRFHSFMCLMILWLAPIILNILYLLFAKIGMYHIGVGLSLIFIPAMFISGIYCLLKAYKYYLVNIPLLGKIILYLANL